MREKIQLSLKYIFLEKLKITWLPLKIFQRVDVNKGIIVTYENMDL
jgi:hypothetical protein